MIKGRGDMVVDRVWRPSNMAFESRVVPEDWRSAVILPLYKGKGERAECRNFRGMILSSMVEKSICGNISRQSP